MPSDLKNGSDDFTQRTDPFPLFAEWFAQAKTSEINDPHAMQVATVDAHGLPDVRTVLMNGYDETGFVFYTNTQSAKGLELAAVPKAALVFHWKSLRRQVRVRGPVEKVSDTNADAYFQTRPRDSQIGAWASEQSRPLETRSVFEERIKVMQNRYEGLAVPRPPHWTGYRILPLEIEFWHDRPFRLHDRIVFRRLSTRDDFVKMRLFP